MGTEQIRKHRIEVVANTIREALEQEKYIDDELFVNELCREWGVTKSKAKEYIAVARSKFKIE
jgi:hypothetical protein